MQSLILELASHKRTFPIGLSGLPGIGYIITGGISPLSRSQGLAIDQILEISGIWGLGEGFTVIKPNQQSSIEEQMIWRGLCGAAGFLAIITKLKLRTFTQEPLLSLEVEINNTQLLKAIELSEKWPLTASLQWIWGDVIKANMIIKKNSKVANDCLKEFKGILSTANPFREKELNGLQNLPEFRPANPNSSKSGISCNEVIGLLGPSWNNSSQEIISILRKLIYQRPDPRCFIAAQQLGGVTNSTTKDETSFIHRDAIWKPWINAAWPPGDEFLKAKSMAWLEKAWEALEPFCPGVHLAQMHQHLPWHQKETESAFKEWLPGLKKLKSKFDPNGILPTL